MNNQSKKILVIIVTWNKKKYVLDLLKSLKNIEYDLDIVVVDNNSNDGTPDAIRKHFKEVHLIENKENLGGTGGFNTGLSYAFEQEGYDYFWLLDNDVVVNKYALNGLIDTLENNEEIAVCGSSMMQLDYYYRVNETGAFFNQYSGTFDLINHMHVIKEFKSKKFNSLLKEKINLAAYIYDFSTNDSITKFKKVDYVAAASLLIKADIAKKAGLWRDYFIHFDDVEWCFRIKKMGYDIAVSFESVIWHESAFSKIPTWVLYYDNRNLLDMIKAHFPVEILKINMLRVLQKVIYYNFIGKYEISNLIWEAYNDFKKGIAGKKEIKLSPYKKLDELGVFLKELVKDNKKIIFMQNSAFITEEINQIFTTYVKNPKVLSVDNNKVFPSQETFYLPKKLIIKIIKLINYPKFDYIVVNEYDSFKLPFLIAKNIIFVNREGFFVSKLDFSIIKRNTLKILKEYLRVKIWKQMF